MPDTTDFQPVTSTPLGPAPLTEVSDISTTISYLREHAGLTVRELAYATGAEERSVRRWTSPDVAVQQRYEQRIDDLRALAVLLVHSLPGEQTGRWLRARNRLLKGARPLDLLADGRFEAVYDAAAAFVDGDPI